MLNWYVGYYKLEGRQEMQALQSERAVVHTVHKLWLKTRYTTQKQRLNCSQCLGSILLLLLPGAMSISSLLLFRKRLPYPSRRLILIPLSSSHTCRPVELRMSPLPAHHSLSLNVSQETALSGTTYNRNQGEISGTTLLGFQVPSHKVPFAISIFTIRSTTPEKWLSLENS